MASIINSTTTAGVTVTGDNSGSLQLATNNGTTAVTIDTSQNVGIGTSSPSTPLNIVRNAAGAQKVLFSNNSSGSTAETAFSVFNGTAESSLRVAGSSYGGYGAYTANNTLVYNDTSAITIMADNASNGIIKFAAGGNTERMRIDSSGNLRIGCTAEPISSVSGLQLSNPATQAPISSVGSTTATATHFAFVNGNGTVGRIQTSGSSTSYNTSSDYRLKENIAPMVGALTRVTQLKPVTYTWKIDGSSGEGFIAHELQSLVPECVTGEKDAVETYTDEKGNEQTRPAYQGIDTSFLVATLTAAIQELNAKVDAQAVRIAELEGAR
jgi:hypothetical protein